MMLEYWLLFNGTKTTVKKSPKEIGDVLDRMFFFFFLLHHTQANNNMGFLVQRG